MNKLAPISEMNKTIAEFMNVKKNGRFYEIPGRRYSLSDKHYPHNLRYSSSWEWIMPVVEKIESIHDDFHGYFGVHISSNCCCIQGTNLRTDPGHEHYAYFNEVVHETKLTATYWAVHQFIQWYNKNKQDTP